MLTVTLEGAARIERLAAALVAAAHAAGASGASDKRGAVEAFGSAPSPAEVLPRRAEALALLSKPPPAAGAEAASGQPGLSPKG